MVVPRVHVKMEGIIVPLPVVSKAVGRSIYGRNKILAEEAIDLLDSTDETQTAWDLLRRLRRVMVSFHRGDSNEIYFQQRYFVHSGTVKIKLFNCNRVNGISCF